VLDLGCGDGLISGALATAGAAVTGIDPSQTALARARERHPDLRFLAPDPDGTLPLPDSSFDVVACVNVLEHVADTQRLMSEARRVLAPGARIAIVVPFNGRIAALVSFERVHDPLEPVLRFYTRRSLAGLLPAFRFENVEVAAAGGLPLLRRKLLARATRA
jgi:2-polyprenyl-6-hydroxyphenyl methylase/3-demethylubiquinone-9 3-methyltransferase